ncbi:MAG: type II secretion system protein [Pseudomonadota bacterium]
MDTLERLIRVRKNKKGFTLIELLMVITVIGILAAIALSQFTSARMNGYNSSAKSDLKNVYNAAYAYFSDNPTGTVAAAILQNYGYRATTNVGLSIADGTAAGLSMTASYNISGSTTYAVNSVGAITP